MYKTQLGQAKEINSTPKAMAEIAINNKSVMVFIVSTMNSFVFSFMVYSLLLGIALTNHQLLVASSLVIGALTSANYWLWISARSSKKEVAFLKSLLRKKAQSAKPCKHQVEACLNLDDEKLKDRLKKDKTQL